MAGACLWHNLTMLEVFVWLERLRCLRLAAVDPYFGMNQLARSSQLKENSWSQLDRSAIIGSIRDARRAGKYPATSATTISSTIIPTYVTCCQPEGRGGYEESQENQHRLFHVRVAFREE